MLIKSSNTKSLYITIVISFLYSATFAQAGILDSTFDADGKVTTAIGIGDDVGRSVAVQFDNKIIVAGYSLNDGHNVFSLVRYKGDGTLDSSFNANGIATTSVGSVDDKAWAVAIQSDEKIVLAGFSFNGTDYDFAVLRYTSNGSLDSSFGEDGKVTTDFGFENDQALAIGIQPDGKIVAAGASGSNQNYDFSLARYNTDGSLDISFGTGGKVRTAVGSGDDVARGVTIQPDGKIVLAGWSYNMTLTLYDFALVRYNSDGTLDDTFSTDGIVTTPFGSNDDSAFSLAVTPNGKILAVGSREGGMGYDFALVQYNSDGTLDSSFSEDGKVATDFGSSDDQAFSVAIQSDGKIITAGHSNDGSLDNFALARYNTDGTADSNFSLDGRLTTSIGLGSAQSNSIAIQSDGKIVAAGFSSNGQDKDFALARYLSGLEIGIADFSSAQVSPLIYPNPIREREAFKYTLTKDEVLTLNLYGVNGALIKTFFTNETRQAGRHAEELNFGNLAAGNYLLSLSNGAQQVSVKIVKQ